MNEQSLSKLSFGHTVETAAAEWYMRERKARILERNYRIRAGEIDLILEETRRHGGGELVFVEVRARLQGSWEDGISSVTFRKRLKLSRAIRNYLWHYSGPAQSLRADILAWDGKSFTHLPDVRLS